MKIKFKKHLKALLVVSILIIIPSLIPTPLKVNPTRRWFNNLPENYDYLRKAYNATMGFDARKLVYLADSNQSDGFYAQSARIYLNNSVNEASFTSSLNKINNREDTADFRMTSLLRMMYLDNKTEILNSSFKSQLKDAILNFKY